MKGWLFAAALVGVLDTSIAQAQVFPTRPITMNVPFAAGGPTDVIARIFAARMRSSLGQTVVIENVTGADGSIGVGRAARAAPDGYTLSVGAWSTHVLNGAAYSLPYDVYKDFEPVSLLSSNPLVIVTNNKVPAKDLPELIAWIKANKDKVAVGLGSMAHRVAAVYFQNLTGTSLTFIPYRGAGPATQDLISGQIQIMFDQVANSIPHIKAGSTKAYGMTSATRLATMPEIPNVDEAGLPGFYISVWNAVWVPKGTPKPIITKLNAAIGEALADPAVGLQLTGELGQELPSRQQQTPEYLGALHKAEIEKWWPLLKAANIRGE